MHYFNVNWLKGIKHELLLIIVIKAVNCYCSCFPYSGSVNVFSSDDSEIFHHGGCSSVHGEIVEMRFEGSSFLTVKLHMKHERSYVRSEFVILEGGESLNSGKLSITQEN